MLQFRIVLKIVLPLTLALFTIATISIYSLYYIVEDNISKQSLKAFNSVSLAYEHIISQDTYLMESLIEELEKDAEIIKLFKEGNKKLLFKSLNQKFSKYKTRHEITHFYIHNINQTNFLRVHNENLHSDKITRVTLQNAAKNLSTSSGVEFGIYHNLTLRVVLPWFVDEKLIGFIEMGKDIDKLSPKLHAMIQSDIIFTIKKKYIPKEHFLIWKNRHKENKFYKAMNNYYVIDSTITTIGPLLQKLLDHNSKSDNHFIVNANKKYFINSQSNLDISGKHIGKICVLHDVSKEYDFLYALIFKITIIVLILLILVIAYYTRYIKLNEIAINRAYKQIQKLSITDTMTNLYNKNHYLDNGQKQFNQAMRRNTFLSFILIDTDNFKKYNDQYGHIKGDDVLISIAASMKNIFQRATDISYRVGGEEFLIISEDESLENGFQRALLLCENIEKLEIEHIHNNNFNSITVSIGVITQKVNSNTSIIQLYDNADKALYKAKKTGKNRVIFFNSLEK